MCRKASGAAFRSRVAVPRKNFRWLKGEALLTGYVSSPGTTRTFCKVCGSTLVSLFDAIPQRSGSRWAHLTTIRRFRRLSMYSSARKHRGSKSPINCHSSIASLRQRSPGPTARCPIRSSNCARPSVPRRGVAPATPDRE
ncbi:MAG: GFA family protein [Candidatus Binataceae bacterium]